MTTTPRRRWILALAVAGALIAATNFALAVFFGFHFGGIFRVPNAGMDPVIARDDSIYMNGLAFYFRRPARGDVVCFHGEDLPTLVHRFDWQVKRVVGLPGETISLRDGQLYVGDHPAPELAGFHYAIFMFDNFLTNENPSYTVPEGTYFVLGDNPKGSYDSRFFGPVPAKDMAGTAVFRFWPPARAGVVR